MRALLCERFGPCRDAVRSASIAAPGAPAAHEVIVRVAYASVSHATGLLIEGRYQRRPPLPFSPGTEAVGVVVACGSDVRRLRPGQRVALIADWGCYAELLRVPQYTVYPVPDALPLRQALPVPLSYGTAYTGLLWRCGLRPGESVLVLGAGAGLGLAAVQLGALLGARVIACASTPAKREAALRAGAVAAIAPDEALAEATKEALGGQGADIVVDPVGGTLAGAAVRAMAANGRYLSVGFASGELPAFPANILLVKNVTLHAFFFGRYIGWTPNDERIEHARALQHAMATLLDWAARGRLTPQLSRVYPMHELAQALADLHGRQVIGKIALEIDAGLD
ncbi:NADPH:quinone oxidoreductase family protein [Verticiella sediminum]|uniref:NADPH:quinone oxidoreductase family protein n=1 Tax=Verticiella sediminum TaxID=1247510 RepID=A0A556ACZ7_9BURK|nr:NADPH:quinone oxidoreductase family protein [Verticiella sediminum]TSH90764.1 NADPH:quinone oxidoreductase family protein [Verticiella sediminum]